MAHADQSLADDSPASLGGGSSLAPLPAESDAAPSPLLIAELVRSHQLVDKINHRLELLIALTGPEGALVKSQAAALGSLKGWHLLFQCAATTAQQK
jgi:hypothetical protein